MRDSEWLRLSDQPMFVDQDKELVKYVLRTEVIAIVELEHSASSSAHLRVEVTTRNGERFSGWVWDGLLH